MGHMPFVRCKYISGCVITDYMTQAAKEAGHLLQCWFMCYRGESDPSSFEYRLGGLDAILDQSLR